MKTEWFTKPAKEISDKLKLAKKVHDRGMSLKYKKVSVFEIFQSILNKFSEFLEKLSD